jgi:hypothetical protein
LSADIIQKVIYWKKKSLYLKRRQAASFRPKACRDGVGSRASRRLQARSRRARASVRGAGGTFPMCIHHVPGPDVADVLPRLPENRAARLRRHWWTTSSHPCQCYDLDMRAEDFRGHVLRKGLELMVPAFGQDARDRKVQSSPGREGRQRPGKGARRAWNSDSATLA